MNDSKHVVFRFGDFELREREHRLLRAGEEIYLQPRVFRVLLYLVHNRDRVVHKEEILRDVWDSAAVTDNSLTRSISWLRKALDDDPKDSKTIRTISSIGYRFVCAVREFEDSALLLDQAVPATGDSNPPEPQGSAADDSAGRGYPAPRRFEGGWLAASSIGILALLAAGFWYLGRPLPPPRITAYTQLTHDGHDKSVGATDGSRIFFTQSSPNFIAQIGITGGQTARLPLAILGQELLLWDISPDGSNALISSREDGHANYPHWVAPVLGGPARHLLDGGGGAFSPDGTSIIYSTVNGDIFLMHADGTGDHKLASVAPVAFGWAAFTFRWSPDRKTIRFSVGLSPKLWEMSANGSGLHPLLANWRTGNSKCCGNWTPDGSFYIFETDDGQLWALDERRSLLRRPSPVPVQLTSGPIFWGAPVPGRDGRTIFAVGAAKRGELSRIDLKTGNPQPFLGGISAEYVSFSPDGKSVAYVTYPEGTLWKADRDGANPLAISQGPDYVVNPRWSPDSKEIVFGANAPDGHFSIHRVSAANGLTLWLIPDEVADTHDPNWSPDGTKVLFCLGPPASPTTARLDLRIVDLKTRQVTTLPDSEGKWSPRWSPDGRYIAASGGGIHPDSPAIFDLKTQRWHKLPVGGGFDFPSFSADGRFVYFLRYGHDQGVFRIPVTGGKAELVLNMANWHLTGNYGFSMSLDPTDAPLVLRDRGSSDIYSLSLETK